MNIGNRIHERRCELDISINELARRLDMAPSTVLRYETSDIKNMGIDKVADMAAALNCDPGYLLGWTEDIKVPAAPDLPVRPLCPPGYDKLDEVDRAKADGYIEALLSADKYKKTILSEEIS